MAASAPSTSYDLVVVGCGVAGLSAAVSALEAGARVAILERAPKEERGGNSRWTEAFFRLKSLDAVADDFESHFAKNAGHHLDPVLLQETAGSFEERSQITRVLGFTDPDIIARFADRAPATVQWLQSFGVKFDFYSGFFITTCTTRMAPAGGGLALVEALAAEAERRGATFLYRTSARRLISDEAGRVVGVVAAGAGNRMQQLRARAVVLACGGFEGNPEMLVQYLGPQARNIRPVARGGYYNKGEGIRMALDIGAAPCGDFGRFHAEPLDPRSGVAEPVIMAFNYGILVNRNARRFVDEAPSTVDATYEAITRTIYEQPDGIAWCILDGRIADVPNWRKAIRSDQPAIEAPTLAALAAAVGIDGRILERTVAQYNAACPKSGRFDPLATDGLATDVALEPPKSNWARPLDKAPFLAFPIICGNCFTFGGLKVSPDAQVLNVDGEAIPGLYAAGETMGLYYGTYTGATSVMRGAVFGRIAGAHAARLANA